MFRVSVIVPTYNRVERLQRVLAALEGQTVSLDSFEVIIVSDGSTDGTNDFLQTVDSDLRLTAVFQANSGAAAARNNGLRHAKGALVLFIDDDVVPAPQLLAEHLRFHERRGDDLAVLGPMLTPGGFDMVPWVRWEQAMLVKQYNDDF